MRTRMHVECIFWLRASAISNARYTLTGRVISRTLPGHKSENGWFPKGGKHGRTRPVSLSGENPCRPGFPESLPRRKSRVYVSARARDRTNVRSHSNFSRAHCALLAREINAPCPVEGETFH